MRTLAVFLLPVFLFSAFSVRGEECVIPAGTPIFRSPETLSSVSESKKNLRLATRDTLVKTDRKTQIYWGPSPLVRKIELHRSFLPEIGSFWFSADIVVSDGELFLTPFSRPGLCAAGILLICAAAVFLLLFLRKGTAFAVYPAILCAAWGALTYMIGRNGNFLFIPLDENFYCSIASSILKGDFSGPWRYPIGFPLLCAPFLLVFRPGSIMDFIQTFSVFGGFVIFPLSLIFAFLLIRRMADARTAAASIFVFLIMIVFYSFDYRWPAATNTIEYCKAWFGIPRWLELLPEYNRITWFGYNALSDTPAMTLMLGIFLMTVLMRRPLIPAALLFAFACLVRIPNILFAPALLYLLLLKYREAATTDCKAAARFFLVGAFMFLAVVSVQLYVNWRQFGNPLTSPYSLHRDTASVGFMFSGMADAIKLLAGANYLYLVCGLTAPFFMRGIRFRFFLISLYVPVLFFFSGYSVIYNNGHRFLLLLFPFLLAGFFSAFRNTVLRLPLKKALPAAAAMAFPAVFVSPCSWTETNILPFSLQRYEFGPATAYTMIAVSVLVFLVALYVCRHDKQTFRFLLLWGAVFFAGSPYLVFVLPPVLALLGIKDALRLYRFGRRLPPKERKMKPEPA